jgi:hypothetical protein
VMRAPSAVVGAVLAIVATVTLSAPIASASGPTEDSPQWDCRIHGNRVCGPGNGQNVPAGDYSTRWLDYSDDFGA